jgi:hypothetical protein
MSILAVILATVLLMGLGLSILLLGTSEAVLAAHDRTARALREASLAVVHLTIADLRRQPSWSAVLAAGAPSPSSAAPGRAVDLSLVPAAPWGGPALDLRQITVDVATAADTAGGDPQLWRLYEYGSLPNLVPGASASPSPFYVAAWVADDRADGDGDPLTDTNGILAVRAAAYGPADIRAVTAVSIGKATPPDGPAEVLVLAIRPLE